MLFQCVKSIVVARIELALLSSLVPSLLFWFRDAEKKTGDKARPRVQNCLYRYPSLDDYVAPGSNIF